MAYVEIAGPSDPQERRSGWAWAEPVLRLSWSLMPWKVAEVLSDASGKIGRGDSVRAAWWFNLFSLLWLLLIVVLVVLAWRWLR